MGGTNADQWAQSQSERRALIGRRSCQTRAGGRGLGGCSAVVLSVWLGSRRRIEGLRSSALGLTNLYLKKTNLN